LRSVEASVRGVLRDVGGVAVADVAYGRLLFCSPAALQRQNQRQGGETSRARASPIVLHPNSILTSCESIPVR
jgi:hypothetical protein